MATPEIKSVAKAFSLLECLAGEHSSASLPAMAKRCGLTVSTAHRLLATMESLGAVVHTGPGEYSIGMRMIELSRRATVEGLLASSATPILNRITRATGRTAHIGVLDPEGMVTYVARSAPLSMRLPTHPGNKLEAYCSGLGKVLLSGLPAARQHAYLSDGPFPALTERTIIEPGALAEELTRVSEKRFAMDDREMFDDLSCVAVPILDPGGYVVAALSVSSTRGEITCARAPDLAAELAQHADMISAKLYPPARSFAH